MARLACADLVDPVEVAVFHCINRCVRRSFLCGDDPYSGNNYDHRKQWLESRIKFLAGQFGIDIVGFAILSNHFHLVLRSRPDVVATWDDTEVARRWLMLCPNRRDEKGNPAEPTDAELDTMRNCPEKLVDIRRRLSDISWLMRMVAEPIAKRANREDEVTGRFWEGRYKCVKLCDEAALLACLAYVDLNPIRAGIALSSETSDYTSVQRRIEALLGNTGQADWLAPLELDKTEIGPLSSSTPQRASDIGALPMTVADYLELLDWTGRQLHSDNEGSIPNHFAPIFTRLGIPESNWLCLVKHFGRYFSRVAGAPQTLAQIRPKRNATSTFRHGRAELFSAA